MLSKEQIDRLDELAESVKVWGSCNQSWLFDDDDGYQTFSVGHVSYDGVKFQAATVDCANYDSNDGENLAAFYAAANPQAISELIAMLREAKKDAARWKYWRRMWANEQCDNDHHLPESVILILNDADLNEAMDEAMQLDCDGAQHADPSPLSSDPEKVQK